MLTMNVAGEDKQVKVIVDENGKVVEVKIVKEDKKDE